MLEDMDVSVIIVNYNTKELTKNCIDSVFAKTSGVSFEVILVDNASTDGSVELFEKDERILFIESGENLGFGKANNLGYQHARGKYLFLLNSDTLLLNNAIKEFYLQMEQRSKTIACMGCLLVDGNNMRIHSYGDFPTLAKELIRKPWYLLHKFWGIQVGYDDHPLQIIDDHTFEVEYVTGADLFIRKSVADEYGLFDSDFFMYYEETEMQYRYRKRGNISVINDLPKIQHLVGGSEKSSLSIWERRDLEGTMLCYEKMYGRKKTRFFKYVLMVAYIPLALVHCRYSFYRRYLFFKRLARL